MDRHVDHPHHSAENLYTAHKHDSYQSPTINANSKHIENKKKIVTDLMALRRMKLMQQNRLRSTSSLSFEMPNVAAPPLVLPVDKKNVEPLLKGTVLKKELDHAFGTNAIDKATEHFAKLTSEKQRPNSRENVQVKRKQFLDDLTKQDRSHLQENRRRRVVRQEKLVEKQVELKEKINFLHGGKDVASSQPSSHEELGQFVNETEKRIKDMEHSVKYLKIKYGPQSIKRSYASPTFHLFKLSHREQISVVEPILDDILEEVYQRCSQNSGSDSKLIEILLQSDWQNWDDYQVKTAKRKACLDLMEEIVHEVCHDLIFDLCEECEYLAHMSLFYSEDVVFESAHATAAAVKGNVKKAPEKIVGQTWYGVKNGRGRSRAGVWVHSQSSVKQEQTSALPVVAKVATPPLPVVVESGTDVDTITSENVIPKEMSQFGRSAILEDFTLKESEIWESAGVVSREMSYCHKPSLGVKVASLSYDHKFLAVGSVRGDILVYDMIWQPSRPVRVVAFASQLNDAIMHIHWSLDSTRLLTLTDAGCVVMWSVWYSPYVSITDLTSLDIEEDDNNNAQQLTALCVMESLKRDFTFQEGPLTSPSSEILKISHAMFDPALSFGGSQNFIVVALKNGDILRCDLSFLIHKRCTEQIMLGATQGPSNVTMISGSDSVPNKKASKIGQSVNAELFRYHRFELGEVFFIRNNGDLITLDLSFNFCHWRRDSEHMNTFGWFTPFKKFKLSFVEEILIPQGKDVLRFEDEAVLKKNTRGRKQKNRLLVERERQAVLRELNMMNVKSRKPWHTDEFPDELEKEDKSKKPSKFITRIYSPPDFQPNDVSAGGVTFFAVTYRRDNELLVKYAERVYEPSTVGVAQVLMSSLSPSGDRLYFMLLYDEHKPKVRKHITFIDLDLDSFQMGNIGPLQINVSTKVFNKCKAGVAATFSLSRVNGVCGTEYIAFNIAGNLQVYSLLSGKQVVHTLTDKDKIKPKQGLTLLPQITKINVGSKLLFVNPAGLSSYIVILPLVDGKGFVSTKLLHFKDNSTKALREAVQSSYKAITELKQDFEASGSNETLEVGWFHYEQAHVRDETTCREMPTKLYTEMTLNALLDIVVSRADGYRIPQEARKNVWKQDWVRMQKYFAE